MLDLLHRIRTALCASLLVCVALGVCASSAFATKPTFTEPAPGSEVISRVGQAITPVTIKGTLLASLKPSVSAPLPKGLKLEPKETETEWVIVGTPTEAKAKTTVTLEATNESETTTLSLEWTVHEPLPTITKPADLRSTVNGAATVVVAGTRLEELSATGLPPGVKLHKVSPQEWTTEGAPTAANVYTVLLTAKNTAKEPGLTSEFQWTVEEPPSIEAVPDQTSTAGTAIATIVGKGVNLAQMTAKGLPAGLKFVRESEVEWKIEGTPTTPAAATEVTLEALNKAGSATTIGFKWTVNAPAAPKKEVETPSKPPETPVKTPEAPKASSAGRLGTVPIQKQGRELFASFLCEVASCKVTITGAITAYKSKFKIHSVTTAIAQGKKVRIPLKLSKKQRTLISAALKKRKKVTASLTASIDSSVGMQVTKALVITVKR